MRLTETKLVVAARTHNGSRAARAAKEHCFSPERRPWAGYNDLMVRAATRCVSSAVRTWFSGVFGRPTASATRLAAIARGESTLILAPDR